MGCFDTGDGRNYRGNAAVFQTKRLVVAYERRDMALEKLKDKEIRKLKKLTVEESDLMLKLINEVPPDQVIMVIGDNPNLFLEPLLVITKDNIRIVGVSLYGISYSPEEEIYITEQSKVAIESKYPVTVFSENASDLSRRWKDPIGLLIILYHEYFEEVKASVACWQDFLTPEAVVVILEGDQPGATRAIYDLVNDGGNFAVLHSLDKLTAMLVDGCRHYWAINSHDIGTCKKCGRNRNFKRIQKESMYRLYKKRSISSAVKQSIKTKRENKTTENNQEAVSI